MFDAIFNLDLLMIEGLVAQCLVFLTKFLFKDAEQILFNCFAQLAKIGKVCMFCSDTFHTMPYGFILDAFSNCL